jgi:hypothetical protein
MPYSHMIIYYLACGDVECTVYDTKGQEAVVLVDLCPVQAELIRTLISKAMRWDIHTTPSPTILEIKTGYFS